MKRKKLAGISGCFALLLFSAVAWAAPAPDTGQARCPGIAGNGVIRSAPGPGPYTPGGYIGVNSSSAYTKLDGSGRELPDYAPSWSMVKDNTTGLIWEMKTGRDGVKNYSDPHDADNTYTWVDSSQAASGGNAGAADDGRNTQSFIDALNSAHFGGYSDWRLPSLKELNSIVNYDIPSPGPTINAAFFPNTQSSFYWSSTASAGYDYRAWVVGFDDGYGHNYGKYGYYYVRAVRGRQTGNAPGYKGEVNGGTAVSSAGNYHYRESVMGKGKVGAVYGESP